MADVVVGHSQVQWLVVAVDRVAVLRGGQRMVGKAATEPNTSVGRTGQRDRVPGLATGRPILERLDGPPPVLPPANQTPADQARRQLIRQPGQWMALNPRVKLNEASARRLARSFQRSKPARLDEAAAGRFDARAFLRGGVWLVAAVYQPDQ